jgi:hypothetical protein
MSSTKEPEILIGQSVNEICDEHSIDSRKAIDKCVFSVLVHAGCEIN